jgi:outer membrane protein assembly factor BamB
MRSPGDGVASFAALECATGKVVWKGDLAPTPEVGKGWSGFHGSPVPVRIGERTAVFCDFFRGAGAVWADTGEKFWVDPTVKVKNRGQVQVVFHEGHVFLHGTVMARIAPDGKITTLWEGKVRIAEYDHSYSHTIIRDGKFFAFTPGNVRMLDVETGKEYGSLACARRGAILWADGLLYLMDERPAMTLIEATPEGLRPVSSFSLPFSANKNAMVRLFTPPVVAEGRLFVRDQSRVLVYDLRAGSEAK